MLLITGITGLTGRFLYEELLDKKKKFKCLVRKSSGIKSLRDYKNVEFVYGDVANEKDIINALEGVNEVDDEEAVNMLEALVPGYRKFSYSN